MSRDHSVRSYIAPPPVDRSTVVDYELRRRARAAHVVLQRGYAKIVPLSLPIDDVWAERWIERSLHQIADRVLPTSPVLSDTELREWATARNWPFRARADRLEARRLLTWEFTAVAGCLEAHLVWIQPS